MPRVTAFGDVGAGNAGPVSLNGAIIAGRGTVPCFLDPTRLMYQRRFSVSPERWGLEVYDLAIKQYEPVPFGERGANFLAAAGGRWFAYAAGLGVYDATGTIWPAAGLAATGTDGRGAIGQDGTVGWVRDRANGHGLQLLAPNGEAIDLPDVAIQSLCVFDRTLAVWVENGQLKAHGRSDPAPQLDPVAGARIVRAAGEDFLLVTTNTRLMLRRWNRPVGKLLADTPTTFHADAAALNDATIRVVWSRTDGEAPDVAMLDVAVADLEAAIEAPPAPQVPRIGKDCLVAWFTDRPTDAPGHADVWVDFHSTNPNPPAALIRRRDTGEAIAQYVAGNPDGDLTSLNARIGAAHASNSSLPVIAYWSRGAQAVGVPDPWALPGVELYWRVDETLAALEARGRAAVARCGPCVLVVQAYTSNPRQSSDIVSIVHVASRIARDCDNVRGVFFFNSGSRVGGYDDHPEVYPLYAALFAGVTGIADLRLAQSAPPSTPAPTPQPTPVPPKKESPVSLSKDDVRTVMDGINDFYTGQDGLRRQTAPLVWHDRAAADWIALGVAVAAERGVAAGIEEVKRQIRTFPEWQAAHQGESPVNPQ